MPWFTKTKSKLQLLLSICTLLGCIQAGISCLLVYFYKNKSTRQKKNPDASLLPPVTILKPLANNEPLLMEALQSFCEQDYPNLQIIFGVQDKHDTAIEIVQQLKKQYSHLDMHLVINPKIYGINRKVSNLINMIPYAKHDYLLISDSDIHTPHQDYLKETIDLLNKEEVGLVTSLYSGLMSTPSFIQALASAHINYNFMPGVILSRYLKRQDCLGACIAIKRSLLEEIGGLNALLPHIADDAILGQLVRKKKLTIALSPSIVQTTISENSLNALYKHELRWNRTVFTLEPTGFVLSFLQLPLFWALLSILSRPFKRKPWLYFIGSWVVQIIYCMMINKKLNFYFKPMPLILPLRDWLSAYIMMQSILKKDIEWRGQKMTL